MPNTINRLKPNPMIKVEKDNENKDIRRKLKFMQKGKPLQNSEFIRIIRQPSDTSISSPLEKYLPQTEATWKRATRAKKTTSSENVLNSTLKSRTNLHSKSATRLPPLSQSTVLVAQMSSKKSLRPNTNSNRHLSDKRSMKKIRIGNTMQITEPEPESVVYLCKPVKSVKLVKEILTARSMCNSKSSSDDSKSFTKKSPGSSPIFKNIDDGAMSVEPPESAYIIDSEEFDQATSGSEMNEETQDEYETPPLIAVPSRNYSNSSSIITNNFRDLLKRRDRTMEPGEIRMIKNVVKSDKRCRNLKKDDGQLFKDILKTQLRDIVKQETVLKSALNKLDSSNEVSARSKPSTPPIPSNDIVVGKSLSLTDSSQKKAQVDVIFKNVPTLEKEIIILKALGEKLEATLKRSGTLCFLQNDRLPAINGKPRALRDVRRKEHNAEIIVRPTGIRQYLGFVREFHIVQKTLVDLKKDSHRHFYLPTNNDKSELKRTNYRRLKNKPDILMRHLKSKNSLVPFNVLEQDPIFFNSFLFNNNNNNNNNSNSENESQLDDFSGDSDTQLTVREGGDSKTQQILHYNYVKDKEPLKIEEIPCPKSIDVIKKNSKTSKIAFSEPVPALKRRESATRQAATPPTPKPLFEAPIRGKQRRRIRRNTTPMSPDKYIDPKNGMMKTILVGAVQVAVFLILIMAVTYPDIKC